MDDAERSTKGAAARSLGSARASRRAATRLLLAVWSGFLLALPLGPSDCRAQARDSLRLKTAQEIAPFRLTGVDGYVQMRYLRDDNQNSDKARGTGLRTTQSDLLTEVFLMTHSYVYHPSLLTLDIGGGPVFDRSSYAGDAGPWSASRPMFNFSGRATFLREKPYRGVLFYDHKNQTQGIGPAQIMNTETTEYGGNFSLLKPVSPVPVTLEASRFQNKGVSPDQVIDDNIDRVGFRADANVGRWGTARLSYIGTQQESRSGSPSLPIQATSFNTDAFTLDTRLRFGAQSQYDLTNLVTYNGYRNTGTAGSFADLKDFRFFLDVRGRHTEDLQTFARYNYGSVEQGDQSLTLNSAGAGVNYRVNSDLTTTLAVRADDSKVTQYSLKVAAIDGSAQYKLTLPVGQASAGYTFAYSQRDQAATGKQTQIFGEPVTLTGTAPVALSRSPVTTGSVVVHNQTRTQTYVEGSDYVLSLVGITTRIQRLIGGNIFDGQELLLDYSIDVGGTFALNQLDQTLSLNWGIENYVNVYTRLFDSSPHLTSGNPTTPINPVKSTVYGVRADVPLQVLPDLRVGGYMEREDRREFISPARRASDELFTQVATPFVDGSIRLGARRTQVRYEDSPLQTGVGTSNDVDLKAYDLSVGARLGYGVFATLFASRERDTGTPEVRERSLLSAKAQWRVRKFRLTFDLTRSRDAQGATERRRTYAMLVARRDF